MSQRFVDVTEDFWIAFLLPEIKARHVPNKNHACLLRSYLGRRVKRDGSYLEGFDSCHHPADTARKSLFLFGT
jgi:hypothetical protein